VGSVRDDQPPWLPCGRRERRGGLGVGRGGLAGAWPHGEGRRPWILHRGGRRREGSVAMAGGSTESGAFKRKEEENKPFIFTDQWHGG